MGKGFTLIELLVVVLIIGILAAIALPKYRRAVEKSSLAEALLVKKAIDTAANRYYLENGKKPISFKELDIDIPAVCSSDISCEGDKYTYYMAAGSYYKIRRKNALFELETGFYPAGASYYCIAGTSDTMRNDLCKDLCQTQTPYSTNATYTYYVCK